MQERLTPRGTPGTWQGLGWEIERVGGATVIGHEGGYGGYETRLALIPSAAFAVAVLTNSHDGHRVAERVRDVAIEHLVGPTDRAQPGTLELPADALVPLSGRYAHPTQPYTHLEVAIRDGSLEGCWIVRGERQEPSLFRPTSSSDFIGTSGPDLDTWLQFLCPDDSGRPAAYRYDESRIGGRLDHEEAEPPPAAEEHVANA
jgi:hypothetical protein